MRRLLFICLIALCAPALLASAPLATAAPRKASPPRPKITRVSPMRVSVGNPLTISGKNFKPKRTANTVIFRGPKGRTAFAKPRRASRRKLVVVVPESVSRLLKVTDSKQRPTRLKLRVLAGRFSAYTPRRLSPVVTGVGDADGGPGGGGAAKLCKDDADHDNDLLDNGLELALGTDPCLEDTDGDKMIDGWEHWSAKDLNIKAVPYPGKRPFTNALDPSDGGAGAFSAYDFDGDGLTSREEYRAWRYTGSAVDMSQLDRPATSTPPDLESMLGYSDGTKFSRAREVPAVPGWRSASIPDYGLGNPPQPFPATFNLFGAGVYPGSTDDPWRDGERDADADGLANRLESARGPYANSWQKGFWPQEGIEVEPWKNKSYCGQRPGYFEERPFADLDLADPDVDGDSLLDGEDDQDNDDFINIVELYETEYDLDGNGAGGVNPAWCGRLAGLVGSILFDGDGDGVAENWAVNAFNPCVPNRRSRTCSDYVPF
jgi:hypothetical protein